MTNSGKTVPHKSIYFSLRNFCSKPIRLAHTKDTKYEENITGMLAHYVSFIRQMHYRLLSYIASLCTHFLVLFSFHHLAKQFYSIRTFSLNKYLLLREITEREFSLKQMPSKTNDFNFYFYIFALIEWYIVRNLNERQRLQSNQPSLCWDLIQAISSTVRW